MHMKMYRRMNIVILLSIVCIFGCVLPFTSDELRVTLSNGSKLVGRYLRSYSGRPIKGFTGIPYAKPPIGPLRFKAPEPLEKWDGEYKAINDGPKCSQRDPFIRSFDDVGTEDCLYLNVYVPHAFDGAKPNLPIMVYIHGGGFMCGTGIRSNFGPDYFLDHNVILVTANYRVGPLGFLSTEDENCPGNFGLKDQVMVLKWVRDNINQFGGDSQSVTIFGPSAGGSSVTYLMASPLTKGLFSKAIAMSGTCLASWSQPPAKGLARERAKQLAKYFDCHKPNDWPNSIDCLRNVPAANITAAIYNFFKFDMDPMLPFPPVVEPDLAGAFITKHPRETITENAKEIPFVTGITFDEGALKSAPYLNIPGLFDEFANNIDRALPIILYYDHHDLSTQQSITRKIKEFYFNNDVRREKETNITNLIGDGWFLTAMDSYLQLRLANIDVSPTYVYLLTHKGSASFTALFNGDPDKFYGVSHADESLYLFPVRERLFPTTLPSEDDEQVRKAVIQMWTDFARTGNPTPHLSDLPKWQTTDGFPLKFYRIGNWNFEMKSMFGMENNGLFEDRAKFWRELGAFSTPNHFSKDEL